MAAAGGRAGGSSSRSGNASSLSAMIVTSWPAPRAASRTRNGKRPLPAMRPSRTGDATRRPGLPRRGASARRRMTPRCDVRMKSTRYCTSGQAERPIRSICCSALRRVQLRLQQVAERPLQLLDDLRAEAAAHQADRVDAEDPRRTAADGPRERQRVLRDDRVAADERVAADAAELVDARAGADVREVLDGDVAAERRHVAEDRVVARRGSRARRARRP